MHDKFWIFDNNTVWTGSTNITQNGNFRNNNNVIVVENAEVAAIYENEFSEMWNDDEFGPKSSWVKEKAINLMLSLALSINGTS